MRLDEAAEIRGLATGAAFAAATFASSFFTESLPRISAKSAGIGALSCSRRISEGRKVEDLGTDFEVLAEFDETSDPGILVLALGHLDDPLLLLRKPLLLVRHEFTKVVDDRGVDAGNSVGDGRGFRIAGGGAGGRRGGSRAGIGRTGESNERSLSRSRRNVRLDASNHSSVPIHTDSV